MAKAWASTAEPPALAASGRTTTLVEGTTFCISDGMGDIHGGTVQGLFVLDTRVLSRLHLRVDGHAPEPLDTQGSEPYARTFIGRRRPRGGAAESRVLVVRDRELEGGMWERVSLRNVSDEDITAHVELQVDADFADLFAVKEMRTDDRGPVAVLHGPGQLVLTCATGQGECRLTVTAPGAQASADGLLTWAVTLPARGTWSTCVRLDPAFAEHEIPMRDECGQAPHAGAPAGRLAEWRRRAPRVHSPDRAFTRLVARSLEDLGSLRIRDPQHPDTSVVAAGAPWFMALFGRDALLSAWMLLPVDPSLAVGTLRTLARHQGHRVDPLTEEEPGRILHEIRLGPEARLALAGRTVYYGSADATPLFVGLLGEAARWGVPTPVLQPLLEHADAALTWIDEYGDRDGDGFIEYARATDSGLVHQGWKDSADAVTFADGELAEPPIALAEVQAYAYRAFLARAELARGADDHDSEAYWRSRAASLKAEFNARFWLEDGGYYALGLDARKRPIDSIASNMGHCLWAGIVDEDRAHRVAGHLMGPEMFTGFGIRTLASSMSAYNPMSYHNGSVWPHDSALAAAGLMRYGFVAEAQRLAIGLLEASTHFDASMPELFCGFDSSEFAQPVPYPTACQPQAWSSAAPLSLLRTLLRLDPDVPEGRVVFGPALPDRLLPMRVEGLTLAGREVAVDATSETARLEGLGPPLEVAAPC